MNFKKLVISAFAMAAAIVGCKPEEGTALSVEPVLTETMEIDPATGAIIVGNEKQSFTIKVTADCQWAVRCDAEWLDLSAKTGNGNAEIVAYVLDNDASERQVALLFQKHDTKKVRQYVSVLQKGSVEAPSEGEGTLEKPYLASQAAAIAGALASGETTATAVYVKGYVKKFASKHEDGINSFGNALFYITDTPDGTGTDFYCCQVYYLGGQKCTSLDQIKVGDEVVAYGKLTNYNGTAETEGKGAAYIYSINGQTSGETPGPGPDPGQGDNPTGDGTLNSPYSASKAAAVAGALASGATTDKEVYVHGFVKKFASKHEDGINSFGNALFYITDTPDGTGTDFYCFQVYYLGGQKFTSLDQIKLGDEVVVYGKLTNYNGTAETVGKGAAYIYSINGKTSDEGGSGGGDNPGGEDTGEIIDATVAEFIAAPVGTQKYRLKGTITDVINTTYGNFDLQDATGKVLIYGLENIADVRDKLLQGASVTVVGVRADYNGTIEMKEGVCESIEGGQAPEVQEGEYFPDQGFTWVEANDATYGQGFTGTTSDNVLTAGIYKYKSTSAIVVPTDLAKVYKNSVLVIKTSKPFTKLVLKVSDVKYAVSMDVLTGGGSVSVDTNEKTVTWTGNATNELVLHASTGQVRVQKFAFTF